MSKLPFRLPTYIKKPLYDHVYDTAGLSAVTGAWTDLLTINRTLRERRIAIIFAGFVFTGTSAGRMQTRILVDGVQPGLTWRALNIGAGDWGFLNTHGVCELDPGSHSIVLQYYADVSGMTIYDRDFVVVYATYVP